MGVTEKGEPTAAPRDAGEEGKLLGQLSAEAGAACLGSDTPAP